MFKVLIGDDHAVVRRGLKNIIEEQPEFKVLGEASNAHEVLDKARREKWDVIILDITMPGKSGLDTLKELKEIPVTSPILVLSVHPEDHYAVRVLKAGASGYLTKESAPEDLMRAIRKVLAGGKFVSANLAEKLAMGLEFPAEKSPHEILSDREYQVLCMIASGKTVKEIGHQLALSDKTVSTYRTRILEKTRMKSNAELTHYAIHNGLVD